MIPATRISCWLTPASHSTGEKEQVPGEPGPWERLSPQSHLGWIKQEELRAQSTQGSTQEGGRQWPWTGASSSLQHYPLHLMSQEPTTPRKKYKGLLCSSDLQTCPSTMSQDASWTLLSLEKQNALWAWDPKQKCVKSQPTSAPGSGHMAPQSASSGPLGSAGPSAAPPSGPSKPAGWPHPLTLPTTCSSVPWLCATPCLACGACSEGVWVLHFLTEPKHQDMHTAKPADRQTDVGLTACMMSTML